MYRLYWDEWNKYTPNEETYNKFADPPIPMLLLNGDLDPQTGIEQALYSAQQYGAIINDNDNYGNSQKRYFYTIPNAPHFVMFTSPLINYKDNTLHWDHDFETCGFYIIKSFIDPDTDFVPDNKCINWLTPIDWNGDLYVTQLASLNTFGTEDMWNIQTVSKYAAALEVEEVDEIETEEVDIWFIIGIVFICLFGISLIVIFYLICCGKNKNETNKNKHNRQYGKQYESAKTDEGAGNIVNV